MPKNYSLYLKDINDSIISIEKFIKNMRFEQFKSDDKTSSAVIRKLEIIGEATKKIPKNIKEKYPQIPWKDIALASDHSSSSKTYFIRMGISCIGSPFIGEDLTPFNPRK